MISGEVHERVDLYCAHYGLTEAQFFEMAALDKINGTGAAKSTVTQLKALNEQMQILSEHCDVYVRMWLRNTQLFTKEEQQAASPQVVALYERFTQQIQSNLSKGGGFLDGFQQRRRTPQAQPAGEGASASTKTASTTAA